MTTLRVEINRDRDLPALKVLLNRLGLKYYLEDDEWGDLSEAEIEGTEAGLKDIKEGRIYSHSDVVARMDEKIKSRKQ